MVAEARDACAGLFAPVTRRRVQTQDEQILDAYTPPKRRQRIAYVANEGHGTHTHAWIKALPCSIETSLPSTVSVISALRGTEVENARRARDGPERERPVRSMVKKRTAKGRTVGRM